VALSEVFELLISKRGGILAKNSQAISYEKK